MLLTVKMSTKLDGIIIIVQIRNIRINCIHGNLYLESTYLSLVLSLPGKFQMQILSGCGHSVHEDAPDKVL